MARRLQDTGALILTVGIGPDRDLNTLISIAGAIDNYYDFDSWDDLDDATADQIVQKSCSYVPQMGKDLWGMPAYLL